jgi:hypothetical protein
LRHAASEKREVANKKKMCCVRLQDDLRTALRGSGAPLRLKLSYDQGEAWQPQHRATLERSRGMQAPKIGFGRYLFCGFAFWLDCGEP